MTIGLTLYLMPTNGSPVTLELLVKRVLQPFSQDPSLLVRKGNGFGQHTEQVHFAGTSFHPSLHLSV